MNRILFLRTWILTHYRLNLILAAGLALLLGLLAGTLLRQLTERDVHGMLEARAALAAAALEAETMRGPAAGVAALLGRNEPLLAEAARGLRPPDDAAVLRRLADARALLGAEDMFIMNDAGRVVAHDRSGVSFTGGDFSHRPYWRQAMAGRQNVYAAVGAASGRRGLFVAAPLYGAGPETPPADRPVVGVVVVKLSADPIDARLGDLADHGLLLAPDNMVFASSDPRWLLRPFGPAATALADGDDGARAQRYGRAVDRDAMLPDLSPGFDGNELRLEGARHALARAWLDWNDQAGPWQLVLLGRLAPALSGGAWLAVVAGVGLGSWLLFWVMLRLLRSGLARQEAVEARQRAAEDLARQAAHKGRLAEFGSRLQAAADLSGLTRVFFSGLVEMTAARQACLYLMDAGDGPPMLRLAASYGTRDAPASFLVGEGLPGQCALSGAALSLEPPPDGFWRVRSGLLEAPARRLSILPVPGKAGLLGVLEVAFLDLEPGDDGHAVTLQEVLPLLAMNLEVHLALAARAEEGAGPPMPRSPEPS